MVSAPKPASRSGSVSRNRVRSTPVVSNPSLSTTIDCYPHHYHSIDPIQISSNNSRFRSRLCGTACLRSHDLWASAFWLTPQRPRQILCSVRRWPQPQRPKHNRTQRFLIHRNCALVAEIIQVVKVEPSGGQSSGDLIKDYAMHLRESPDDAYVYNKLT